MKERTTESSRWLDEFLDSALESGATGLQFEFDSAGELEACIMCGNTGLGTVVGDRELSWQIVQELRKRANIRAQKGSFRKTFAGKEYKIKVLKREHFDDYAYDLVIEKPKGK